MSEETRFSTSLHGCFERLDEEARGLIHVHESNLRWLVDNAISLPAPYAEHSRDSRCFYNIGRLFGAYRIDILASEQPDNSVSHRVAYPSLALDFNYDGDVVLKLSRFRIPNKTYVPCDDSWLRGFHSVVKELSDALACDIDGADDTLVINVLTHLGLPEDALVLSRRQLMFFAYSAPDAEQALHFVHTVISTVYMGCHYEIIPVVKQPLLHQSWQRLVREELLRLQYRTV